MNEGGGKSRKEHSEETGADWLVVKSDTKVVIVCGSTDKPSIKTLCACPQIACYKLVIFFQPVR
jgi:hypothetical protein